MIFQFPDMSGKLPILLPVPSPNI